MAEESKVAASLSEVPQSLECSAQAQRVPAHESDGEQVRRPWKIADGKIFYCGHWRSIASVEKRLGKMRQDYRKRHPLMNVYQLQVRAVCPIHADLIDVYDVTIRTSALIEVEKILGWFKKYENRQIFQEVLTQESAVGLGVSVEVVGMHAGVKVTCVAP